MADTAAPPLFAEKQIVDDKQAGYPANKRHLTQILKWYPRVLEDKILDLGCGSGKFLTQVAEVGGDVVGIEPSQELIDEAFARARSVGVAITIRRGTGESLPFPDGTFGFVNMAEVIEHVADPERVLREVWRVLKPGGGVYVSVPNRFGIYDPHYHAYFVNLLPRSLAAPYLKLVSKEKDYSHNAEDIGQQSLETMHYYTSRVIRRLGRSAGFAVIDTRESKIQAMPLSKIRRFLYLATYKVARVFYFDTFHIGLIKH